MVCHYENVRQRASGLCPIYLLPLGMSRESLKLMTLTCTNVNVPFRPDIGKCGLYKPQFINQHLPQFVNNCKSNNFQIKKINGGLLQIMTKTFKSPTPQKKKHKEGSMCLFWCILVIRYGLLLGLNAVCALIPRNP